MTQPTQPTQTLPDTPDATPDDGIGAPLPPLPAHVDAALVHFQQQAWNGRDAAGALDTVRTVVRMALGETQERASEAAWSHAVVRVDTLTSALHGYLPPDTYTSENIATRIADEFAALHRLNARTTELARETMERDEQARADGQEALGIVADVNLWLSTYGALAQGRTLLERLQTLVGHQSRELVEADALRAQLTALTRHAAQIEQRAADAERRADAFARDMRESVSLTPEAVACIHLPAAARLTERYTVAVPAGVRAVVRSVQAGGRVRIVVDLDGVDGEGVHATVGGTDA